MSRERGNLSINSENLFPIIKKWLYSDHDIFVREVISNGTDAITKLKKLEIMGEVDLPEDNQFKISVTINPEEKTICFSDNGIGMTADEIKEYINQIAFSGAQKFIETYKDKTNDDQIIGHFGLGFYSVFMVASKVTIDTLSWQKDAKPVHWVSESGTEFEMGEGSKTERGTDITLYLNDDSYEFSNEYRVKEVINKYCSFMPVEIYFTNANAPEETEKDNSDKKDEEVISTIVDEDGKAVEAAEAAEAAEADKADNKPQPLNNTSPLWAKHPNDCTDEEYKEFYRNVFHDYKEPLFWIHLNMDYPFNLKGILYFPQINTEYDSIEGVIKLYNNQVFVADNIKEVIPEYLMLLKGVIDCPDFPLNVSRSALQNDGFVKKISDYISKKVADKLSGMYKVEREDYEKYWDDISPFIKFGCLKDEKFNDKMKDSIIYKNLEGKYITLDDYIEATKSKEDTKSDIDSEQEVVEEGDASSEETTSSDETSSDETCSDENISSEENNADNNGSDDEEIKEEDKTVVYYVTDEKLQSQYINMFKEVGGDALILKHNIDQPFITNVEYKNQKVKFQRIDTEITDGFRDETKKKDQKVLKNNTTAMTKLFREVLAKDKLEVKVEKLKNDKVSSMITLSEEGRRMQDMMKMYNIPGMDANMTGEGETLVLNANHELVQYIITNEKSEHTPMICEQLFDLAYLSHKPLEPEAMTKFIQRNNEIMMLLTK